MSRSGHDESQPRLRIASAPRFDGVGDDLLLARRCAADDASAQETLFRRHAPALHRLVSRMIGDASEADDVVQDAFVSALDSIGSYRGDAPLSAWLRRVAIRCASRHLTARQRRRRVQLELIAAPGDTAVATEPVLTSRAMLRRINELLQELTANQRAVFLLHEVDGYSLPETAALLDISVTAAKKRVWRARAQIERLARRDPGLRTLFVGGERDA